MSPSPADELILAEQKDREELTYSDIKVHLTNKVEEDFLGVRSEPGYNLGEILDHCNDLVNQWNETKDDEIDKQWYECKDKLYGAFEKAVFEYALK